MIVLLIIRDQIVHIDNREPFRRICFAPASEAAGPSESTDGPGQISGSRVNDCPETKSVTISLVRKVEKLLSGETICAHQINCRTAHEPCPVIDTTAGKHL